jgi:hypothetical protein
MKTLLKLEELAQVLLSIYLFSRLPFAWWIFPVFFFAADVSLIGYLAGGCIGAIGYNLVHHKAIAIGAYIVGGLLGVPLLSLIGVLLLGHASLDRVLGYGLVDFGSPGRAQLTSAGQRT